MRKNDSSIWVLITFLAGVMSTYFVSKDSITALLGGAIMGVIGYILSKVIK